jgi:hypothetical protein
MDGARGALVPLATGFRLKADEALWGAVLCRGEVDDGIRIKARMEHHV